MADVSLKNCCFLMYIINYGQTFQLPTPINKLTSKAGEISENILEDTVIPAPTIFDDFTDEDNEQYYAGLQLEDKDLNFTQLVTKYGYPVVVHDVETIDGYILKLFRIPSNGPVVFLMHGLLASADDWLIAGPTSALAYLLADEGYDVWLGNARGNKHSKRHVSISPDSDEFWDFSWDEIGRYDLPAMIDYTLKVTNESQLTYIGHSQGNTGFFVMCSELPAYNEKISHLISLSPVVFLGNTKSVPLKIAAPLFYNEQSLDREVFGPHLFKNGSLEKIVKNIACGEGDSVIQDLICNTLIFTLFGFDKQQTNFTTLASLISHLDSEIALKQLEHYVQSVQKNTFKKYDYGETKNMKIYGCNPPPDYPIEKITLSMTLFHSDNDLVNTPADVETLVSHLKAPLELYRVPYEEFNHVDFLYAKDVKQLLYTKVLEVVKNNRLY